MGEAILEVKGLKKHYPVTKGIILMKQTGAIKAVDGIDFTIKKGETFGLVGESGCGKTTTAKMVLLQEEATEGTILFQGKDITHLPPAEKRKHRGLVQAVFQDPYSSLSPRMKVGRIIAEPIVIQGNATNGEIKQRIAELLDLVGLRPDAGDLFPHEFSGGQRQRVAIARALASNPSFIVLDEPVSALDVSIRAQIMNLLMDIQENLKVSYLLIAHDLAVVQHMSETIGVMYLGKLVEIAGSEDLHLHPTHPYTKALLSASLAAHPRDLKEEIVLKGEVPSPLNPPTGCWFHPRCPEARHICAVKVPQMIEVGSNHKVACHKL
ncbi:ATP-binding cassette domain-containing protein [bacterium]|nr:ATP-binding cassette domain-containing protein [bacterium]